MRLTPHGARTHGALVTYCAPRLAKDAKLPDIAGILAGATTVNRVSQRAAIATAIQAAIGSRLAQDADLSDVGELVEAIERISQEEDGEDGLEPSSAMPMVEPDDEDTDDEHPAAARVKEICERHNLSPEVCNELAEAMGEEGMDSYDRRARDVAKRMGRDETESERERREDEEGAEDAKRRMGRDESPDERRMRRAEDAARHVMRRARDVMRRMGKDAKAEDRARAEDELRRARDAYRKARDARRAEDRARAEDARRAEDRARAEDRVRRAEDACRDARNAEDRARAEDELRRARDAMEPMMTRSEMKDAVDRAVKDARAHDAALYEAHEAVRPWVGKLSIACDSAPQVYRAALKALGRSDADQLHESALRTVLELMPKPGERSATRLAQDSSTTAEAARSFSERFPNAARVRTVN